MTSAASIRMNDFERQWAQSGSDVQAAVERVGRSGWYILGREVAEFERQLAEASGARFAVGVASGLDALEIALRCAGLPAGAGVLTTPMSAFATTLAIVRAGLRPVFVDIDASGLLDLGQVERAAREVEGLRAIVPVHLFGHAVDLAQLRELSGRLGLVVIEDAAQAIGARSGGERVGAVGRATALSFYPTKNLGALGDGGALLTDDEALAAHARRLRDYGQSAKYVHAELGLNSRLDELQAAILRTAFLPRLREQTERRVAVARRYHEGLAGGAILPLPTPAASGSVWHLFPVRVPAEQRAALQAWLRSQGVESGVHYPTAIPDQPAMVGVDAVSVGDLAGARRLAAEELSLPIHPHLTDDEVDRVVAAVRAFEGGR